MKPDFKGEKTVSGPLLLETIQPPFSVKQYIQVHRLSENEDLSLLLLAYYYYGAAMAVIFVNTSEEFQLHQGFLSTLPASTCGEEYSKLLSVLVPKNTGTDLVKNIPFVRCIIHSTSIEHESLEPAELTKAPSPSLTEKGLCESK